MLKPGWIRTLSPISANWMEQRAPTLQSLPILTSAPITAPEPITVPAPISTFGPITASGSTMTPSSRCAVGSMTAEAAMPVLPNQDCGRSASRCSSRAIFTNSRKGWAARKTATWAGTSASNRLLTRHAPAFVEASWSAYFRLSKNARCIGPASSSEASPATGWPPRDGSTKCASVNAAISASVDEGGCSKNVGCAIPPVAVRLVTNSERCPAAKLELLHPVEWTLGKRNCIVEAQRTERRRPDQADTDRRANDIAAVVLQSQAGSGRYRTSRRRNTAGRVDLAGGDPGSRSLIIV